MKLNFRKFFGFVVLLLAGFCWFVVLLLWHDMLSLEDQHLVYSPLPQTITKAANGRYEIYLPPRASPGWARVDKRMEGNGYLLVRVGPGGQTAHPLDSVSSVEVLVGSRRVETGENGVPYGMSSVYPPKSRAPSSMHFYAPAAEPIRISMTMGDDVLASAEIRVYPNWKRPVKDFLVGQDLHRDCIGPFSIAATVFSALGVFLLRYDHSKRNRDRKAQSIPSST